MRKEKTIELNGKQYVIKELTQRQISDFLNGYTNIANEAKGKPWPVVFLSLIPRLAGIDYEIWLDFTPSESMELIDTLKEVNANFLKTPDLLESWGLGAIIQQIKASFKLQIEQFAKAISNVYAPVQAQSQEEKLPESNLNITPTSNEQISQPQMQNQ